MPRQTVTINTLAEYEYMKSRGVELLMEAFTTADTTIALSPALRIDLQRRIFGRSELNKGNVVRGNDRFYHWVWNNKPHYCEECMRPLHEYSSVFISHILSRSGHADMAHDPRNTNILCGVHHKQWESRGAYKMRIYHKNTRIIETLREEYKTQRDVK